MTNCCNISTVLFTVRNRKPTQQELNRYVSPKYAAQWRELGVELGLLECKLNEIEANNPLDCRKCCNRMLAAWLTSKPNASWKKLFDALESPVLQSSSEGKLRLQLASILGHYFWNHVFHQKFPKMVYMGGWVIIIIHYSYTLNVF